MNTYSVCRGASARLVLIGLIVSMGANVGCDSWVSYTADVIIQCPGRTACSLTISPYDRKQAPLCDKVAWTHSSGE